MTERVYLDFAASTPVDGEVAALLAGMLAPGANPANPSSIHAAGREAATVVARAQCQLAGLLNCQPEQVIWTSGATESDNLAILGAAGYRATRGRHLVTMPTEHKAVVDAFRALEKRGFEVTWLDPDEDGLLPPERLRDALREDTQLVSVMAVNNETGVIQDIAAMGELCRANDTLFHVDAAQGAGKISMDLAALNVDFVSITAHKIYGPKGVGALIIKERPGCHIEPILHGGGQQRGLRPGTQAVPLIAAFGLAAELAEKSMSADFTHVTMLRDRLWQGISDLDGIRQNGDPGQAFPGILNVSIDDMEGESLLLALEPLCVATGSACNSRNTAPSGVLKAMGLSDDLAQSAIRFSFGRPTLTDDIDRAIDLYRKAVGKLRTLAPPGKSRDAA